MPASITYTPIATTTLSSAQSSVTFSSISGSYTDLVLVANLGITNANTANVVCRFNSDTNSNYSVTRIYGSGTAATSDRVNNAPFMYLCALAYPSGSVGENIYTINIQNYSNTTTNKTVLTRANRAATGTDAIVGLWRSTAAITSVTILLDPSDTYKSGSTFSLYGITAA
jgi:hypothetical protein